MDQVGAAWQQMLSVLQPYLPRVAAALLILIVAAVGARLARALVSRLLQSSGLVEKTGTPELPGTLAGVASALVWVLALPALLSTLELHGLLAPVNAMVSKALAFVPNLAAAAAILGIGLLAAKVLAELVVGVLTAAGSERLAARLGLGPALGERTLAGLAGTVVRVLVLLPVAAAATQALGLEALTQPVSRLMDSLTVLVPRLLSAGLVLLVFVLVGRMLASLATALLVGLGFNRLPELLGLNWRPAPGRRDPSELAGALVMVATVLLGAVQAGELLGVAVLSRALEQLGGVGLGLLTAGVILALGLWLGNLAAQALSSDTRPASAAWARAARLAVLVFAAALAMRQAGLPVEIVTIAFGGLVGALALGAAIALGLGGRRWVARWLERLDTKAGPVQASDEASTPVHTPANTPAGTPADTPTDRGAP